MLISANDRHVMEAINRCCGRIARILPPTMTYHVLEQHEEMQDALRFNLQRIAALVENELSVEGLEEIDIPQLRRVREIQNVATPLAPISTQNIWSVVRYDLSELRSTLFRVLNES